MDTEPGECCKWTQSLGSVISGHPINNYVNSLAMEETLTFRSGEDQVIINANRSTANFQHNRSKSITDYKTITIFSVGIQTYENCFTL